LGEGFERRGEGEREHHGCFSSSSGGGDEVGDIWGPQTPNLSGWGA